MIRHWPRLAAAFIVTNSIEAFGIFDRTFYGEWEGKPGDTLTLALNILMATFGVALFFKGLRRLPSIKAGAGLMLGLAALLLFSVTWSVNPAATIRQGIIYLTVVIGTIGIASNLEVDEYMKLVAMICGVAALSSLLLAVAAPGMVVAPGSGDYRGIFSQKNILGQAMSVGVLATLHLLRAGTRQKWRYRLILALLTVVCVLSKSATSLSTVLIFCSVDLVGGLMRRPGIARLLGMSMAALAAAMLIVSSLFPDWMLTMMGKDPTLTGRTEIWGFVISDIAQRPILGWGYNAFWFVENPAAREIDDTVKWLVPQSHNGLLEILLHLGIVGAVLFSFVLVRNAQLGLRCLREANRAIAISCLLACASIVVSGISETVLLGGLQAATPVFFVTGLYCERAIRVRRSRTAPAKQVARRRAMPRQPAAPGMTMRGPLRIGRGVRAGGRP